MLLLLLLLNDTILFCCLGQLYVRRRRWTARRHLRVAGRRRLQADRTLARHRRKAHRRILDIALLHGQVEAFVGLIALHARPLIMLHDARQTLVVFHRRAGRQVSRRRVQL